MMRNEFLELQQIHTLTLRPSTLTPQRDKIDHFRQVLLPCLQKILSMSQSMNAEEESILQKGIELILIADNKQDLAILGGHCLEHNRINIAIQIFQQAILNIRLNDEDHFAAIKQIEQCLINNIDDARILALYQHYCLVLIAKKDLRLFHKLFEPTGTSISVNRRTLSSLTSSSIVELGILGCGTPELKRSLKAVKCWLQIASASTDSKIKKEIILTIHDKSEINAIARELYRNPTIHLPLALCIHHSLSLLCIVRQHLQHMVKGKAIDMGLMPFYNHKDFDSRSYHGQLVTFLNTFSVDNCYLNYIYFVSSTNGIFCTFATHSEKDGAKYNNMGYHNSRFTRNENSREFFEDLHLLKIIYVMYQTHHDISHKKTMLSKYTIHTHSQNLYILFFCANAFIDNRQHWREDQFQVSFDSLKNQFILPLANKFRLEADTILEKYSTDKELVCYAHQIKNLYSNLMSHKELTMIATSSSGGEEKKEEKRDVTKTSTSSHASSSSSGSIRSSGFR